ncbi:MAG: hypothetical protein CL947_01025 [Epsilonproteobacteria bacterium]|nr:hypothetical protein [Campylobacterota bacterium]
MNNYFYIQIFFVVSIFHTLTTVPPVLAQAGLQRFGQTALSAGLASYANHRAGLVTAPVMFNSKVAQSGSSYTDNPYVVLEADPSWSDSQVKSQYRKLAMKFHPDTGGTSQKFQRINNAYDAFKNASEIEKKSWKNMCYNSSSYSTNTASGNSYTSSKSSYKPNSDTGNEQFSKEQINLFLQQKIDHYKKLRNFVEQELKKLQHVDRQKRELEIIEQLIKEADDLYKMKKDWENSGICFDVKLFANLEDAMKLVCNCMLNTTFTSTNKCRWDEIKNRVQGRHVLQNLEYKVKKFFVKSCLGGLVLYILHNYPDKVLEFVKSSFTSKIQDNTTATQNDTIQKDNNGTIPDAQFEKTSDQSIVTSNSYTQWIGLAAIAAVSWGMYKYMYQIATLDDLLHRYVFNTSETDLDVITQQVFEAAEYYGFTSKEDEEKIVAALQQVDV